MARYRGDIKYEVDWDDSGQFAHALSDVTPFVSGDFQAAYGAGRRSNPDRPTIAPLTGSVTLLGRNFAPGESAALEATVLQRRHRFRVMWDDGGTPVLLCQGWMQEPRIVDAREGYRRTRYRLEGLLTRQLAKRFALTHDTATSDTVAARALLETAFETPLSDYNYESTPLSFFQFSGSAGLLCSQFGAVAGAFPIERKEGTLAMLDPTAAPAAQPAVRTP